MDGMKEKAAGVLLRLPKSLRAALKAEADKEGVSVNQYCLYVLARAVGGKVESDG